MKKYFPNQISLLIILLTLAHFLNNASNIYGQEGPTGSHLGIPPVLSEAQFSESETNSNLLKTILRQHIMSADVVDSVIYTQSSTTYKDIYTYSSTVKILTLLKQIYQGGWVNYKLSTFTYDDNGNLENELYENWNQAGGVWLKDNRKTSVYDDQGNKLTYLYEKWDSFTEEWKNDVRYTNSYDVNGNWMTYQRELWNTSYLSWILDWLVNLTYDGSGNELTQLWDYNAANLRDWFYTFTYDTIGNRQTYLRSYREPYTTEWVDAYRYLYTYDQSGNLLIDQSEFWDIHNNVWVLGSRYVFTYDLDGNLITQLSESPIGDTGLWQGSYRSFYSYNTSRNLLSAVTEKWDILNSLWADYGRATYDYDYTGYFIHYYNETWNGIYWTPANDMIDFESNGVSFSYICEELSIYYGALTAIDNTDFNILRNFSLSQNYPNPFNPTTTIKYSIPEMSKVSLILLNLLGEEIITLVNDEKPAGNYSVNFNAVNHF